MSSYAVHGLGLADGLVHELPVGSRCGAGEAERQQFWRPWVHTPFTERELAVGRRAVTTGRPFGSVHWVEATARVLDIELTDRPRRQPEK